MQTNSGYIEATLLDEISIVPARSPYKWLKWLLGTFTLVVPAVIVLSVRTEYIATCLLAYLNCLIIGFGVWRFLRKETLAAMVPVLFLPYLTLSWPVGTIFFAIFNPENAYYWTRVGNVSFFEAGTRVQLAVMLFIIAYFSVMFYALRKEGTQPEGMVGNPGLLAFSALGLALLVILFHATQKITRLPVFVTWLAVGFWKYFYGLLFVAGALIKKIPVPVRLLLAGSLAMAVLFYTIGNARGEAMLPVVVLFIGLVFFSNLSSRTKLILVLCMILVFPMYMIVANTTRILLGTIGFEEGVLYRFSALKEWRTTATDRPAATFFFGRLFFTGGHSIILRTPSERPYRRFVPHLYIREAFEALLPRILYYRPYYRSSLILIDYGFVIIPDVTSVEVSMIGNCWLMGGYIAVFFGGAALGMLHWFLVWILRRNWSVSKMKALLYFGICCHSLLWAPNIALIAHWRDLVYRIVLASILYQLLRLFIGDPGRGTYALQYDADMIQE